MSVSCRTDGRKRSDSVWVPSAARSIRSLVVVLTFGSIRAYTHIYYAYIYQIRIPIGCNIAPPPAPLPRPSPGPKWRPVLDGNRNPSERSANVVDSSYTHSPADQIKSVSIRFLLAPASSLPVSRLSGSSSASGTDPDAGTAASLKRVFPITGTAISMDFSRLLLFLVLVLV